MQELFQLSNKCRAEACSASEANVIKTDKFQDTVYETGEFQAIVYRTSPCRKCCFAPNSYAHKSKTYSQKEIKLFQAHTGTVPNISLFNATDELEYITLPAAFYSIGEEVEWLAQVANNVVNQGANFFSSPIATRDLVGLAPKNLQTPSNWNMKHYKSLQLYQIFKCQAPY